jgi:acyl homoserine lactone synthase
MLVVVPRDRDRYAAETDAYFRLRKAVFVDRLGWDIPASGDLETDEFDLQPCVYLLAAEGGRVTGGVRIMPTTGPTLLATRFARIIPDNFRFQAPTIWELTRFCVEDDLEPFRSRYGVKRVAAELCLAVLDFGLDNGLTHFVAVFDERVYHLTHRAGFPCEIVNMAPDSVSGRIYLGLWDVSEEGRARMRTLRDRVLAREERGAADRVPAAQPA